ncbi:hypothetical protein OEZ86_000022 [Tetradesmus obliquus]|nr:hypothetical protein OEZ86_000022 [Tetradesmus obliquus]
MQQQAEPAVPVGSLAAAAAAVQTAIGNAGQHTNSHLQQPGMLGQEERAAAAAAEDAGAGGACSWAMEAAAAQASSGTAAGTRTAGGGTAAAAACGRCHSSGTAVHAVPGSSSATVGGSNPELAG